MDFEIAIPSVTHLPMFTRRWLQIGNLENKIHFLPKL